MVEQIAHKKCCLLKPSHRLYRVMERLSRDRYLSADDVSNISHKLSKKMSGSPASVRNAAFRKCCEHVGMIRGQPPANVYEPEYKLFLKLNDKKHSALSLELGAFMIFLRSAS